MLISIALKLAASLWGPRIVTYCCAIFAKVPSETVYCAMLGNGFLRVLSEMRTRSLATILPSSECCVAVAVQLCSSITTRHIRPPRPPGPLSLRYATLWLHCILYNLVLRGISRIHLTPSAPLTLLPLRGLHFRVLILYTLVEPGSISSE